MLSYQLIWICLKKLRKTLCPKVSNCWPIKLKVCKYNITRHYRNTLAQTLHILRSREIELITYLLWNYSLLLGNGYITTDVLKEIFRELDNTITADDLETMIEEIDSDGSGTVDFDGKFYT